MSSAHEIVVAKNSTEKFFELPVPVPLLVSWRTRPQAIDAGPAPEVAAVLADALCRVALVSFLSEEARHDRKRPPLVSTSDPAVAVELFNTGYFGWTQRGQIVLLSQLAEFLPAVPSHLLKLYEAEMVREVAAAGFTGLLLPGVDGDLAGLWSFGPGFEERFLISLGDSCRNASMPLYFVGSEEFREHGTESDPHPRRG